MNERLVQKMLAPAQRRLQNMILRGTVALVNAATKMQTLQIRGLQGETLDGLEHFEPYGFTSRPHPGAEHITLFVDGDRSHGITVVVADRRYRLQGMETGEVALHDEQGQSVHMKRDGVVEVTATEILRLVAPNIELLSTTCTHNGVNVGASHTHGAVVNGPDFTSSPV